jgi:hypothetical protein
MANPPVTGQSVDATVAGVVGENAAAKGIGVVGTGTLGTGVFGSGLEVGVHAECSGDGVAIFATSQGDAIIALGKGGATGVSGRSETGSGVNGFASVDEPNATGVSGNHANGARGFLAGRDPIFRGSVGVYGESLQNGVFGRTASSGPEDHAVYGQNDGAGRGVTGVSTTNVAQGFLAGRDPVFGLPAGVFGASKIVGVFGHVNDPTSNTLFEGGAGVFGLNDSDGPGVLGRSIVTGSEGKLGGKDPQFQQHVGVYGQSNQQGVMGLTTVPGGTGVYGGGTTTTNGAQIGVRGETQTNVGVQGVSFGSGLGVEGQSNTGIGVFGKSVTGRAAMFEGDVEVTGDIRLTSGNDCAEEFDAPGAAAIDPGTVMVINEDGMLQPSHHAYDKKVAGVVSGAGDCRPGIVLGKREALSDRLPIALLGKVYCKVDARFSPIEVGDLLTTSPTPGHAMKADDPVRALGTLIGKALRPHKEGQGMIPILVALQ